MSNKKKILWITNTALFIALLIVMQAVTAPFGNVLLTGTIVNLILIISVMTCGLSSGLTVAAISPVLAKFFGIGPLWILIPFIAAANIILVWIWYLLGNKRFGKKYTAFAAAAVTAAAGKFAVIYVGVVLVAIPFFAKLPDPQAAVVSKMFSLPQLITALLGGLIAVFILPTLKKGVRNM